jgi:cobalt-zinc-cadmium efflux system outer membrane protein
MREQIVNEAQLHYNAMQIGILQLLRDREQQIETGVAYVEALRDYWLAWTDLSAIASGRLPGLTGGRVGGGAGQMRMKSREAH